MILFNPLATISLQILVLLVCAAPTQAIPDAGQLEGLLTRVQGVEDRQAVADGQVVGLREDLRQMRDENQELRRMVAHLARNLSKAEPRSIEGAEEGGAAPTPKDARSVYVGGAETTDDDGRWKGRDE